MMVLQDVDNQIKNSIKFIAESLRVLESPAPSDDFVDIEVAVLSTNVTGNGRQYVLEDLQKNASELNSDGGLIFAMGRHPNQDEEPDATDNVGVGQTYMENDLLKAKARIYNTSTFPDMIKRIRLGLVRDVSIEGMVKNFKKTCNGDGCWMRGFGLTINRAVFVHAGADPLAKIEKVLEAIEGDMKEMINEPKEGVPAAATVAESAPGTGTAAPAGTATVTVTGTETKPITVAEAVPVSGAAKVTEAPASEPAKPPAAEASAAPAAPSSDARAPVTLEQVMAVCVEMKTMMADMMGMTPSMVLGIQNRDTSFFSPRGIIGTWFIYMPAAPKSYLKAPKIVKKGLGEMGKYASSKMGEIGEGILEQTTKIKNKYSPDLWGQPGGYSKFLDEIYDPEFREVVREIVQETLSEGIVSD